MEVPRVLEADSGGSRDGGLGVDRCIREITLGWFLA